MPDPVNQPSVKPGVSSQSELRRLSTQELLAEMGRKTRLLAQKEVELARAELEQDLRSEIAMASRLGVAGACGLVAVSMSLVAATLAVDRAGLLSGWRAALGMAGVFLAAGAGAGFAGWSRRVRTPLRVTRKTFEEDLTWVKERMA